MTYKASAPTFFEGRGRESLIKSVERAEYTALKPKLERSIITYIFLPYLDIKPKEAVSRSSPFAQLCTTEPFQFSLHEIRKIGEAVASGLREAFNSLFMRFNIDLRG